MVHHYVWALESTVLKHNPLETTLKTLVLTKKNENRVFENNCSGKEHYLKINPSNSSFVWALSKKSDTRKCLRFLRMTCFDSTGYIPLVSYLFVSVTKWPIHIGVQKALKVSFLPSTKFQHWTFPQRWEINHCSSFIWPTRRPALIVFNNSINRLLFTTPFGEISPIQQHD